MGQTEMATLISLLSEAECFGKTVAMFDHFCPAEVFHIKPKAEVQSNLSFLFYILAKSLKNARFCLLTHI